MNTPIKREIPENIDPETGEYLKPYDVKSHLSIKKVIERQLGYINKNLKSPDDPQMFARLTPDQLSNMLLDLAGMYEYLSNWLATEKLHIADLKTGYDIKYTEFYCDLKDKGMTNETARMKTKLECIPDQDEINMFKHGYDIIEAWKKSIGRYHDSVRSQLSYEKSMSSISRGD